MRKIVMLLLIVGFTIPAYAVQKYNAFEKKWETTSEDAEIKYNAFEEEWSYEQPGSQLEYNAFEETWEYAPPSREEGSDSDGDY